MKCQALVVCGIACSSHLAFDLCYNVARLSHQLFSRRGVPTSAGARNSKQRTLTRNVIDSVREAEVGAIVVGRLDRMLG